MKPLWTLMLAAPVLALLASCASTPLAIKPRLDPPSFVLLRDCLSPVRLPEAGLTASEVESYWLTDRLALKECKAGKAALQEYYGRRDGALRGAS